VGGASPTPSSIPPLQWPGTFHVIATSQADPTKSGTATVMVTKPKETKETKDTKEDKETREDDKLPRAEKLAPKETDQLLTEPQRGQPAAPRCRRRDSQQPTGRAFIAQEERPEVERDILRGDG
jgi:hypothetical protein